MSVRDEFAGEWQANTNYYTRQSVMYQGGLYRAAQDHVSGSSFDSGLWVALSLSAGSSGPYGLAIGKGTMVVPSGVRAHLAFDNNDAVGTAVTYRTFQPLTDPTALTVLPVFTNSNLVNGAGSDSPAGNPITIAAAVEMADGSVVPFTFNGQHTTTVPVNGIAIPDMPLGIGSQITVNDNFNNPLATPGCHIRTYVTVPAATTQSMTTTSGSATIACTGIQASDLGRLVTGTGIPNNAYIDTVNPGVSFTIKSATNSSITASASGTITGTLKSVIPLNLGSYTKTDALTGATGGDLTLTGSGTVSGGGTTFFYGPSLVLTRRHGSPKPIVGLISDSIFDGYQEDFHSPYFGPVARAASNLNLPFVKLSKGGEGANQWAVAGSGNSLARFRQAFVDGCTHVIIQLGTNDGALNGSAGVTSMQNRLLAIGTMVTTLGAKAYIATVPPRTTSTDSWATTTNQTPVTGSQVTYLAQLNQWIRGVPAPFSGVIDLEGACSSAQDSGLWGAGRTADGVHPTDAISRGALLTACQNLMGGWTA